MRRSTASFVVLLILVGFFVLTLFQTISLTAVWRKDTLLRIEGNAFSVMGRAGSLEFESADILFLTEPKTGLSWNSEKAETHQPFWLPRFYEREMNITTRWELRYPEGLRVPIWPFIGIMLFIVARPRKRRRS